MRPIKDGFPWSAGIALRAEDVNLTPEGVVPTMEGSKKHLRGVALSLLHFNRASVDAKKHSVDV